MRLPAPCCLLGIALGGCSETGVSAFDTSDDATPSEWDSVSPDTPPRVAWATFFNADPRDRLFCSHDWSPFERLGYHSRLAFARFGLVDVRGRVVAEFPWRDRFSDPHGKIAQIDHAGGLDFLFVFDPERVTERRIEIYDARNDVWRPLAWWNRADPAQGLILNSEPGSPIAAGWHYSTYAWFDHSKPHLVYLEHRERLTHMERSRALTVIDTQDGRRVASFDLRAELADVPDLDFGRRDHIVRFTDAVGVGDEPLFAFVAREWPEDHYLNSDPGLWSVSGYWSPVKGVFGEGREVRLPGNVFSDGERYSSYDHGSAVDVSEDPLRWREYRRAGLEQGFAPSEWALPSPPEAGLSPGSGIRCGRVLSILDHRNRTYLAGSEFHVQDSPTAIALYHRDREVLRFESIESGLERYSASILMLPNPVRY